MTEYRGLEGAFLHRDGSGVEKCLPDHFCVVGLEKLNNPLPDAFVGGIPELDFELDIPLNVKTVFGSLPLAANLPFRLALKEIKVRSFWLGNYDGEELPVLGVAGLLNLLIVKEGVQFILYRPNWHLQRVYTNFARASYHIIMVTKTVMDFKQRRKRTNMINDKALKALAQIPAKIEAYAEISCLAKERKYGEALSKLKASEISEDTKAWLQKALESGSDYVIARTFETIDSRVAQALCLNCWRQ